MFFNMKIRSICDSLLEAERGFVQKCRAIYAPNYGHNPAMYGYHRGHTGDGVLYPMWRIEQDSFESKSADNKTYAVGVKLTLTYMIPTDGVDNETRLYIEKVLRTVENLRSERIYTTEGITHYVFTTTIY